MKFRRIPTIRSVFLWAGFFKQASPHLRARRALIVSVILSYSCLIATSASADTIAVLYPEIREPYKQVFLNITTGVADVYPNEVLSYAIEDKTNVDTVQHWLEEKQVDGIVALGKAGVDLMHQLYADIPTVVGAVIIDPKNTRYAGITQNPSPELLFRSMQELLPNIKNIYVVYEPDTSGWVIEKAVHMAENLGLELKPHAVENLREGAEAYSRIQSAMNKTTDALWLPVGAPSRDSAILQNILATAWKEDQIVFSSNLADVRRGVLFSMYPDNTAMGRELGRLLKELHNDDGKHKILFLTTLLKAINVRTADHIGLHFSRTQLNQFDYVYPTP